MTYDGLTVRTDESAGHLGGNIKEGDPYTYSPAVWDYAISRYAVTSILDLGSGMGYSSEYFFRKRVRVIAVDGLEGNISECVYPTLRIDICTSPVSCRVDLVHCQEVVEHIEEKHLENLLSSLCCGKFVLMTHAVPGQPGHHHVNLQTRDYWIGNLDRRGFTYLAEDSSRIRRIAEAEGSIYLANSGLIFARRE
jgi:hypothetical protein